jgi:hypothetical protein
MLDVFCGLDGRNIGLSGRNISVSIEFLDFETIAARPGVSLSFVQIRFAARSRMVRPPLGHASGV